MYCILRMILFNRKSNALIMAKYWKCIIGLQNIKYRIPDQVEQERNRNFCGHYMWFLCRLFCKCTGNSSHHMHAQPNTVVINFIYDHHQGYYRIINFMAIIYLNFDQKQRILEHKIINVDWIIKFQYFLRWRFTIYIS